MTPADWGQTLSGAVAVIALGAGYGLWVFKVSEKANKAYEGVQRIDRERAEAIVSWGRRLDKAENAAESMRELAGAVKHMGEMTALEIRTLSEKVVEHSILAKDQFVEIRTTLTQQDAMLRALDKTRPKRTPETD